MTEFQALNEHGLQARVAVCPVSVHEYRLYLRAAGRPLPRPLAQSSGSAPVTYVSQVDARAYCQWLAEQERQNYRLPRLAELLEMAEVAGAQGSSSEVWALERNDLGERQGALQDAYFCEWTGETETMPQYGADLPAHVMGRVFYPPWLRAGVAQLQGLLQADQGHSFVSFRLAGDG